MRNSYPSHYSDNADNYSDLFDTSLDLCRHGNEYDRCDTCDDILNERGGIDKCMCCGKYKYNDELMYPGQTCIKGCRNPNEY